MIKKFSICIPISGNLKSKINYVVDRLNSKNNKKFFSIPHINILSGSYKNKKGLFNKFKKINFEKKKIIKSIGIGVFAGKKNVIYLRFENSNYIKKLRNHIYKIIKIRKSEIDLTATDLLWTPKCTLSLTKNNGKKFLSMLNLCKRKLSKHSFLTNELILMDVFSNKEKILKKK